MAHLEWPENNCYRSPWKGEAMDTCGGGFVWGFFGPLSLGHVAWIWVIKILFSSACVSLVNSLFASIFSASSLKLGFTV